MFIDIKAFRDVRRIPRSREALRDFSHAKKGGRAAIYIAKCRCPTQFDFSPDPRAKGMAIAYIHGVGTEVLKQ